jgi:regulatory protein YycI of two-component signal transduction system YycFG
MSDRFTTRDDGSRLAWAVGLLALGFFLAVLFQAVQLVRERISLAAVYTNQETAVQDTLKLRAEVNALAGDTAQLAQSGDAAAKQVVDQLAAQNVTLHPPATVPGQ